MKSLALPLVFAGALAGTAAAEREPADRVHDNHTMDRLTPKSTFGIELGYEVWDGDGFVETVVGLNLGGHFVSDSGAGGYLVVPISHVELEDPLMIFEDDSETVLGNVEVGGMYARPMGRDADMVFRLGVALPTADDDPGIGLFQALASAPRYGDLVLRIPNSTWLRVGFSPMGRASLFYWRADIGLDLMIDDDDGEAVDISPVFRVNAGGGVDLGSVDLGVELVTNVTSPEDDNTDEVASTLGLGARFAAGKAQPGVAIILPVGFDDDSLQDLDFAITASVMARVD
jgi:hypothetical protein